MNSPLPPFFLTESLNLAKVIASKAYALSSRLKDRMEHSSTYNHKHAEWSRLSGSMEALGQETSDVQNTRAMFNSGSDMRNTKMSRKLLGEEQVETYLL